LFRAGADLGSDCISIPCGKCMGCRLERSRQWAVRIMHESELYKDNCFITLTYNDDNLPVNGSLDRSVMQLFMKTLRKSIFPRKVRVFYCGEYGDSLLRPHYHAILFNYDFKDKVLWSHRNGENYYISDELSSLWKYVHSVIGDVTFDSAAYVARYCVKKVNGDLANDHYKGRLPEFCQASLKPGIGHDWLVKYGYSDVFNFDEVVVRGVKCKPPRYYDKFLERIDPDRYLLSKENRRLSGLEKADDNSYERLKDKFICQSARFNKLVRSLEVSCE